MPPTPLRDIAILLPAEAPDTRLPATVFVPLAALLSEAPNCGRAANSVHLAFTPRQPADALPTTTFGRADIDQPTILFDTDQPIDIPLGGLHLRSTAVAPGGPAAVPTTAAPDRTLLSPLRLRDRLRGHITRIDHFGVNLPAATVARPAWDDLLRRLGAVAALYRYPGEEWPFILPATDAERADDIRTFVAGREPKFELVHDAHTAVPIIQISIGTDLTQPELTKLLPAPYGLGLPGLEHLFRTVYLAHPWPGLDLRVDLNFRNDGPATDWDTGEWLVTAGGRMR